MPINPKLVKALQVLLKEQTGHDYNDQDAHRAGLAIMRFVLAKHLRAEQLAPAHQVKPSKEDKQHGSNNINRI